MFANSKKLTDEQKEKLWKDYNESHSQDLRNQIIEEYAYIIKIIANKLSLYLGSNVEYEDLCSYGIMGLIDAIDKFDINANVKFDTYASLRVRGEMLDNIRKMDWIPRSLRDKQRKVLQAKADCRDKGIMHPTEKDIAKELGIDADTYLDWETQLIGTNLISIEGALDEDEKESVSPIRTVVQSAYDEPEEHMGKEELKVILKDALQKLTEKEKLVIELIYYEDLSAKEASVVMEISESRVSQLHTKALLKMRDILGGNISVFAPA